VPSVAVVLIARNQAWNIARLVASVLRDASELPGTEIVLVDSASADATAEVAAAHPIGVLRLRADQPLTPAAGRYVGHHATTADLVLFLDGDMELAPGWLSAALAAFEQQPDVATVTGHVVDLPIDRLGAGPAVAGNGAQPAARDIPYSAGAAMHRRAVLDDVGTFNPYLHSDEEPELCIRIRHAGHRIVELDATMAYHYSAPAAALATLIARWRRGLYLGAGEAIRHNLNSGVLPLYVRERGYGLAPGAVLLAGAASALRALSGRGSRPLRGWLAITAGVLAADALSKRDARATAHSLLERLLILDGTVRGFLRSPHDVARYPARFDVVAANGFAPPLATQDGGAGAGTA